MATPSLQAQLLRRVENFRANFPTITKADIARHCQIDEANFSAALNGRRGLGADAVLRLHRLMNLSHREVLAKFSAPVRTSKILCLQERGQSKMSLDDSGGSWVPGLSGIDPSGTTGIDDTPDADESPEHDHYFDDTVDTLRQVRQIHRAAIKVINEFIQSSKVNQGSTAPTGQKFSNRRK